MLFLSPHDIFHSLPLPRVVSPLLLLLLLPLRQRNKVNVNGFFTFWFFLPAFQIPFRFPSPSWSLHLSTRFQDYKENLTTQRWFPSDAFRIFQERIFPPRQTVTRGRMASKIAFPSPLLRIWLRSVEFTRKLNGKKTFFTISQIKHRNL